ncbi:MAG: hypothetical protein ACRCZ9_07150, partial [Fusobacteriaceae bacterium]
NPKEIGKQLEFNSEYKNIKGSAFFGYSSLLKNENIKKSVGVKVQNDHIDLLKKRYISKKVLVPTKKWLDKQKTEKLKDIKKKKTNEITTLSFNDSLKNDSRFYVLYFGAEIIKVVGRDKQNSNQNIEISEKELKGRLVTGISIKDRAGVETAITRIK